MCHKRKGRKSQVLAVPADSRLWWTEILAEGAKTAKFSLLNLVFKRFRHASGDMALNNECVRSGHVVGFRPEVKAIGDVDELGGNPKFAGRSANASLQHGSHMQ